MSKRLLISGAVLVALLLTVALLWTGGPGPLAIALGLVPDGRPAGSATTSRGPFVSAAAYVDTKTSYAGGHGGGTTFYDVWSELDLKTASGERRELALQYSGKPFSTGNGFYDVLFAHYRFVFSDDGQQLAISPDGRHWNVAFFNGTAAPLFCRHILVEASEREVWSRMPEPGVIVIDFLRGLAPDAPLHLHGRTDEWMRRDYPWSVKDGSENSELDGVVAWLNAHPEATEVQRTNLETLLGLPGNAVIDELAGRIQAASAFVAGHPELRESMRAKVSQASAARLSEALYSGRVLLGAHDAGLASALTTGLERVLAPGSGAPIDDAQAWTLDDLVWQLGAALNGAVPSKSVVDLMLALLQRDASLRPGLRAAQNHAIRIVASAEDPRVVPTLEKLAAAPPSAEPPLWPSAWKHPVNDLGESTNLGDWARLALQRRK